MARISLTMASLRVAGDELDPEEITRILGRPPTKAKRKGDLIRGSKSGTERIARTGGWRLSAEDREPGDLDAQIHEILSGLTPERAVWADLSSRYKLDLFCGVFLEASNEGISLTPDSLLQLGERGIVLALDIYGPTDAHENK